MSKPKQAKWTYDPQTRVIERDANDETLHIASIIHGVLVFADEETKKHWAHVVANKLKKWEVETVATTVAKEPLIKPATTSPTVTATASPEVTVTVATSPTTASATGIDSLPFEVAQALRQLRYKKGYPQEVETTNVPPCPRPTSGAGDKAPQIVEWYLRYDPLGFVEKYGLLKVGTVRVEKFRNDPTTNEKIKYFAREDGHFLARRMTHLTRRPDNYERDRYADAKEEVSA